MANDNRMINRYAMKVGLDNNINILESFPFQDVCYMVLMIISISAHDTI